MSNSSKKVRLLGIMRPWLAALLALFVALALSACGGNNDGEGAAIEEPANGNGDEAAHVADARAHVEELLAPPTEEDIGVDRQVEQPPPGDVVLYSLECAVPVCEKKGEARAAAAELLGWEVERIRFENTPEDITATWDRLVNDPGPVDAVTMDGVPTEMYAEQLAQLVEEKGTAYVAGAIAEEPAPERGLIANIPGTDRPATHGRALASWVSADTDGDATTVYFDVPGFPYLEIQQDAFVERYEEVCPDCSLDFQETTFEAIGRDLPGQVTSYLQANPDTDYVVLSFSDLGVGVNESLRAAGFGEDVKVASQAGGPANFEAIAQGEIEVVNFPEHLELTGWRSMDALVRHFAGEEDVGMYTSAPYAVMALTEDNIENPSQDWQPFSDEELRSFFADLWQVGS